ncbi:MAG: zinc-ribbon domain-containing protein [Ruminococcus sp.]
MYCSKCGYNNPENNNYCQNCNASLRDEEKIITKQEYLKEYHSDHPGYYALCIFSIIFDIIGAVIIISKVAGTKIFFGYMSSSAERELITAIIIGIAFWVFGSIFLIAAKSMDKKAGEEYEDYMIALTSKRLHNESSHTFQSYNKPDDVWECPNCHCKSYYGDNPECPNCHWKP